MYKPQIQLLLDLFGFLALPRVSCEYVVFSPFYHFSNGQIPSKGQIYLKVFYRILPGCQAVQRGSKRHKHVK